MFLFCLSIAMFVVLCNICFRLIDLVFEYALPVYLSNCMFSGGNY